MAEKVRLAQTEEAWKAAVEHARLTVQETEKRLESRRRERENAQDTALKLDREAERIRERSDRASRIEALRRAVAKLEAEIAKPAEAEKSAPVATAENAPATQAA